MPRSNEMREFEGQVSHKTEAGVLFWFEDSDEEIWLPLSQVEIADDGTSILVPVWLCEAKGL